MKQILTLFFVVLVTATTAFAQHRFVGPRPANARMATSKAVAVKQANAGNETLTGTSVSVPSADNVLAETALGTTVYDLQSNASLSKRIHNWGGGVVSGTWTISLTGSEGGGYADRGTGYNKSAADGTFSASPTARVENVRTGFPAYVVTGSGEEWIFAHGGTNQIGYTHKAANATTWPNVAFLTKKAAPGHLWARAAVGGTDGNTIHVIALTIPTGNGGTLVDGLNGQLRYWRSTNGGTSWDIEDVPVPGIDTSMWVGVGGDSYSIDANGNTAAILVQQQSNDVVVIKSTDNGSTWAAPRIVNDFPLKKYNYKTLYTFEDIKDFGYDPDLYPDSLAMLTTDETGSVMVDKDGVVHVAAPSLFIVDTDTSDASFNYYPGSNFGIIYWNDTWADNQGVISAYSPDLNSDGVWGDANSQIFADGYFDAFSTGASLGIDANGDLYMAYISNNELIQDIVTFEHARQPFIAKASKAGGYTDWGEPVKVLQDDLVFDPALVELSEYYFAQVAKNVDDKAHILWQKDFTKGITLRVTGTQDPEENTIEYLGFPANRVTTSAKDIVVNSIDLKVTPNPVNTTAQVFFDVAKGGETVVEVLNLTGAVVARQQMGSLTAGSQVARINTANLAAGLYFVRVQSGNEMGIKKIAVNR